MGAFITASDIQKLLAQQKSELVVEPGYKLTDIAKELVNTRGIKIVEAGSAPAPVTAVSGGAENSGGSGNGGTYSQSPAKPSPNFSPEALVATMQTDNSAANRTEYDMVILGGNCIIPEIGIVEVNICINGDKIVALTKENVRGKKTIDATGMYVMPGAIDPHTHLGLFVDLDTELVSETRSALLGGVTTVGTYFNQTKGYVPFISELENKTRNLSRVDIIPHLAIRTLEQISELPRYSAMGMNSYKVYMCGVKGIYPHQEDGFIIKVMKEMGKLPPGADPILSIHCENTSICDYGEEEMEKETMETLDDWNKAHPNIAEGEAARRASYFAKEMQVRTYMVHSSTKEAMEALPEIKHDKFFVETTSPYLTLDTSKDIGVYGKMSPPIREAASREALWEALKAGRIDTVGTDNTVMTTEEKNVEGGMREAGPGYPTLATHLASYLSEGIFAQEVALEKLVPLVTLNPAKIFGVYPKKGTIMAGSDADLVILDVNNARKIDPDNLLSRSDFSLYQGKTLRCWPFATIKGGKIAAWDGQLVDDSIRGNILRH